MTESKLHTHTSTGSKNVIVTFIATFIICLFLLDNTAGIFTGIMFVFVGMFTVSVAVAMPFYLYKKKHPNTYSIASIIEFLVTIFLTAMLFLSFFTNSLDVTTTVSSANSDSPYVVICDEPIPTFTLVDVIPSKVQADAICSCIWKKLSLLDRNLSASLARNEPHNASEEQLRLFNSNIDIATESCKIKGL